MSFLWNLISKAEITEDMLKEHSIPILEYSKLNYNYIEEPIVISGFGKFYKGTYNGHNISLKEVDITISQNIIREFILWKRYQNNPNFLKLKGVILYYNKAYIIFEDCFDKTLEMLLAKNYLDYAQKIDIILL